MMGRGNGMTTYFINAKLIDPEAGTVTDGAVCVEKGVIASVDIGPGSIPHAADVVDCRGKYLAPGIVDLGVKVCEPGERHKESYRSAGQAAAAGGVTTIITRPDTDPTIDSPETLEFVTRRANEAAPVHVVPMAALTKGRAGREMTEIGFLMDAGAAAFTDCDNVVADTKVFARALTYARSLGALVIAHPQEPILSGGAKYHADQITTARALPALARAKNNGLDITAGVGIHHLTLNALDVADYRTFFKLKPPLRDEDDRLAVAQAVADGLIDIICSMHTPQDEESKRLPFEEAASGAVGLETLLPAAMRLVHADLMDLPTLWRALSLNPAKRLGLPGGRLTAGAPADLVLFDADAPFVLDRSKLHSKSLNTPFDGMRMQGKVIQTYVSGSSVFEAD